MPIDPRAGPGSLIAGEFTSHALRLDGTTPVLLDTSPRFSSYFVEYRIWAIQTAGAGDLELSWGADFSDTSALWIHPFTAPNDAELVVDGWRLRNGRKLYARASAGGTTIVLAANADGVAVASSQPAPDALVQAAAVRGPGAVGVRGSPNGEPVVVTTTEIPLDGGGALGLGFTAYSIWAYQSAGIAGTDNLWLGWGDNTTEVETRAIFTFGALNTPRKVVDGWRLRNGAPLYAAASGGAGEFRLIVVADAA